MDMGCERKPETPGEEMSGKGARVALFSRQLRVGVKRRTHNGENNRGQEVKPHDRWIEALRLT